VHGRTGRLIGLLLIGIAALALAACGGDSDPVTVTETTETPTVNDSSEEIDELEEQVEDLQDEADDADEGDDASSLDEPAPPPPDDEGGTGGVPGDAKSCGSGVFVQSSTTSCEFGLVVAQDYFASGGGSFESFSPATGKNYSMSCSDGSPITCTGGENAVVYIASS
jgi:hypothetical protein